MLLEVRVKNFAIVEDGTLSFKRGMTAFTGETGAGKSLLLNAITLLLGAKAQSELVRSGAKSAEVEGTFDLSRDPEKRQLAESLGFSFEEDDDGLLMVRREISGREANGTESGRNRIWIQGRASTRTELQNLLGDWVEISGQHEFLRLGREEYLLKVIDQFGGIKDDAIKCTELVSVWKNAAQELDEFTQNENNHQARLDFLKFQIEDFERAGVSAESASEEERLLTLRTKLGSLEKIRKAFDNARSLLDGSDANDSGASIPGIISQVHALAREIKPFEKLGANFQKSAELSENLISEFTDLGQIVSTVLSSLDADPEQLEEAETKISHLNRLKRKYNVDTPGLFELRQAVEKELQSLEGANFKLSDLRERAAIAEKKLRALASKLHKARMKSAESLQKNWEKEIRVLGMKQARVQLNVEESKEFRSSGLSTIEALFSANAGEELRPLAKVASGGELSRIMLALKSLVAGRAEVGVYLFDEVDAGIGGETAVAVGTRLRSLSEDNQVLVVTHLAQTAAQAHFQFRIAKQTDKGRTRTLMSPLGTAEREAEIARMLGSSESKAAKVLAKELLKRDEKERSL